MPACAPAEADDQDQLLEEAQDYLKRAELAHIRVHRRQVACLGCPSEELVRLEMDFFDDILWSLGRGNQKDPE